MPYTAQVLSGETPLEALKTEWRDLFDAADSPNPFLSAEWVFAWLKHIEPHLFPITLIVRDENEKLAAAWPFFEYPAIGGRGLWAGLSDTAYILDPLFISNDPELKRATLQHLEELLDRYRMIWVPLFNEKFVRETLESALSEFPNIALVQKRVIAPYIDLTQFEDFDAYLESVLGAKTRKSLRYDSRQLEKLGNVEYVVYRTEEDYLRIETEMRTIEKVSWKGRDDKGMINHKKHEPFFKDLLPALMARGQAEIIALRLNQMAIAFQIAIRRDKYYGYYHIAYLPDYHKHSPGKLLMLHNIERAMNEGCTEFDFMEGGYDYKLKFCTGTRNLMDVFVCQRSFAGRLNYGLARLTRFLRRKRS